MKTAMGYHRHLDGKLAKIDEEWLLNDTSTIADSG